MTEDEFRALAAEITTHMGNGWTLATEGRSERHCAMRHTDGRGVDLWDSRDGRISASGCFPVTDTSVKNFTTSAAVGRGPAAIARQISGARFMDGYAAEYRRVKEHNDRRERQEAARRRVYDFLKSYIPEDVSRGLAPSITPRQAYEPVPGSDRWAYSDRVTVDLEIRDLSEEEARMIMRAYSIAKGHTPAHLRPAV
jgi:hypothetical protein